MSRPKPAAGIKHPLECGLLVLHEGLELKPYKDTLGITTCLVGYNVQARGWDFVEKTIGRKVVDPGPGKDWFKPVEAFEVLDADVDRLLGVLAKVHPTFLDLDPVRRLVVLDMAFNMGVAGAMGFKLMLAAADKKDWSEAAKQLHRSHWAIQVEPSVDLEADAAKIENDKIRGRADRDSFMLLTGRLAPDVKPLIAIA